MKALLLSALLAVPAAAVERFVAPVHAPAIIAPGELPGLLLPRAELPLTPSAPDIYPRHSDFSGTTRYEELYVALKKDASPAQLEKAARALAPAGGHEAAQKFLRQELAAGRKIPLSLFIPEPARDVNGKEPDCAGPNCFNATALWHGHAAELDHMLDDAALDMLFDHFTPLARGERLRFGDVISVHTRHLGEPEELQHTAVYVGERYVWHKASYHAADPWTFETVEDALRPYTRPHRNAPKVELRLHRPR